MNKEIWFIEKGTSHRRKGKEVFCQNDHCKKKFIDRLNGRKKYCSTLCRGIANRKQLILNCDCCKKTFNRVKSKLSQSKSGLHFCSRKCKEKAQSLNCQENKFNAIKPNHYGTGGGKHDYRNKCFTNALSISCVDCGEVRKFLLSVHHIDGDRRNNKLNNLEIVCHNCHAKRHLRQDMNGEWIFITDSLTPRELINKL